MSENRLRGERFETKPKEVIRAANYSDQTRMLATHPDLVDDLEKIVDCLEEGRIIPPRFYRRGIERTPDQLLNEEGIKHLHLGGGESDILLFAVEYEDRVVLLEVNSHMHFESEPIASALRSLHCQCLAEEDIAVQERRETRIAERIKAFTKGLLPRRFRSQREDDDAPHETGP